MSDEWNQKQRHFHIDRACGRAKREITEMAREATKRMNRRMGQQMRWSMYRIELARRELIKNGTKSHDPAPCSVLPNGLLRQLCMCWLSPGAFARVDLLMATPYAGSSYLARRADDGGRLGAV